MEDSKTDRGEGKPKDDFKDKEATMTKQEVMATQKKFQEISIEEIKNLKTLPPADIQSEIKYLQPKMQDKLWIQTGVDQDDLEFHITALKMEEDKEYLKML